MATKPTVDAPEAPGRTGILALTFGALGGPLIWVAHLLLSYLLVYLVCGTAWEFLLYAVTVVAVAVVAAAGYVSWRVLHSSRHEAPRTPVPFAAREGFVGITGIILSVLFGGIILVTGSSPLILGTCR